MNQPAAVQEEHMGRSSAALVSPRPTRAPLRRALRSPQILIGGGIVLTLLFIALLAAHIAPYPLEKLAAGRRLSPPSAEHWFGADEFGRDIFSRIVFGSRLTLSVGIVAVGIGLAFGVSVGAIAAYAGGWLGGLMMRSADFLYTFPDVLVALGLVAFLGPSLTNAMVAVGISGIPYYARVTYGIVLSERQKTYVEAAHLMGAGHLRVIVRHVLPNVLAPIIVVASLGFSSALLSAAALSFLGLGAQPPAAEWGLMLATGRNYIVRAPWIVIAPGAAIFVAVIGFNILGDGIRDLLDPRHRERTF